MTNYLRFISTLSAERMNKTFLNSDKEHAIAVLTQIFKQSQSYLRIFAGSLCSEVSTSFEYVEALSEFLERGGKLDILLNEYNPELAKRSNTFKRLAYYISQEKSIRIKATSSKPFLSSDPLKKPIHFTVGDENSYRIETDTESRTAECNFNNPDVAKIYLDFFDQRFDQDNASAIDVSELFS